MAYQDETKYDGGTTVYDIEITDDDIDITDDGNITKPDDGVEHPVSGPDDVVIGKGVTLLDTYRVESDAIVGGMGKVWRVHHAGWNVDLALKQQT